MPCGAEANQTATFLPVPNLSTDMGREAKKAKAKQSKAKDKKKKAGKAAAGRGSSGIEVHVLRQQLAKVGCQLTMEADGNCLFRTLSDQLHGDQMHFGAIRQRIVDYIKDHQDDLEPFMEDEEKFDHVCPSSEFRISMAESHVVLQYVTRMAEDGTWGGNLELFVAAQVWQHHIVVHQVDGNRTMIDCGDRDAESFHVCYYNDEHYDSIRSLDDDLTGAPLPIQMHAETSKICVDVNTQDSSEQKDEALAALAVDFPHTSEDDLIALWKQFNCDPARVRKKLAKQTPKKKRR
ncbi:Aste57867_12761 [Aphanomyces stellatus]|uniref:Aste57867_12761 protein n=1 Tax=Aphanomyces stellatus TaxID=120398 RepID=A0A485KWS7_9STRA|nr:hypothetical protein As57867_012713 [Aphanomyces stellatus]VFT89610.1 Aste57867_12761 [Aphanomyces stellatus]